MSGNIEATKCESATKYPYSSTRVSVDCTKMAMVYFIQPTPYHKSWEKIKGSAMTVEFYWSIFKLKLVANYSQCTNYCKNSVGKWFTTEEMPLIWAFWDVCPDKKKGPPMLDHSIRWILKSLCCILLYYSLFIAYTIHAVILDVFRDQDESAFLSWGSCNIKQELNRIKQDFYLFFSANNEIKEGFVCSADGTVSLSLEALTPFIQTFHSPWRKNALSEEWRLQEKAIDFL